MIEVLYTTECYLFYQYYNRYIDKVKFTNLYNTYIRLKRAAAIFAFAIVSYFVVILVEMQSFTLLK